METKKKKLPVGIEMFRDIREHDFYYIDKTGFIKRIAGVLDGSQLIYPSKTLWEKPEYGYAESFFEIGTDKRLFDGLEISTEKQICEEYMGEIFGNICQFEGCGRQ